MSDEFIVARHDGNPDDGPPEIVEFKHCQTCGRTNIYMSMGKTFHITNGVACEGPLVTIKYRLIEED